jgi:hypothetical protein
MPLQVSSPPRLHSGPRALVAAPTSVPGGMIPLCPARFPRSQAFASPAIRALASNASLSSSPCSSAPISGGCVGLWYTLAPELLATLLRTFRRHPGGSSGCTRDPASASGAQPLPLTALRRSAAGCALAPLNSSPCAGPVAALARLTPAQIPPAPSHGVFPAHPARPRSTALATSASAPPSPCRLLSAQ